MTPQERNWLNLFGKYTEEGTTWHALTTVYSPELEVIRAYKFSRKFSTNIDRSIIYHQNTYYLPDNQIKEQSWELQQEKCNQPDGVFHPEAENMRAIGFGNGTSIWVLKQLETDKKFGSEVFFQHQDWRHSIIPLYEENKLERIVIIKENQTDFPTQIDKSKIDDLSGKWKLKQIKMTPSLQISTQEVVDKKISLDLSIPGNEKYLLPEKIMLSLPKIIAIGQKFEIVAGKQIRENSYKQIKINYDTTGKLISLISEVYDPKFD